MSPKDFCYLTVTVEWPRARGDSYLTLQDIHDRLPGGVAVWAEGGPTVRTANERVAAAQPVALGGNIAEGIVTAAGIDPDQIKRIQSNVVAITSDVAALTSFARSFLPKSP